MTIFSVGLLGLAVGATTSIRSNQINLYMQIATNLAQDKLEELKGKATGDISTCASGCEDPAPSYNGKTFTRTWTKNVGGTGNCPSIADISCVTVTVSWTDYQARQIVMSSAVKG